VTAQAETGDCNAPAPSPSVTLPLPAAPFMVVSSKDGCWVFVSLTGRGENSGIAVLKRSGGKIELVRVVPFPSSPTGITLTHDGNHRNPPEARLGISVARRVLTALSPRETLSKRFDEMYAETGRPSIPPEKLLRAQLIQMLYSVHTCNWNDGPNTWMTPGNETLIGGAGPRITSVANRSCCRSQNSAL
jgi:hypothetical protein